MSFTKGDIVLVNKSIIGQYVCRHNEEKYLINVPGYGDMAFANVAPLKNTWGEVENAVGLLYNWLNDSYTDYPVQTIYDRNLPGILRDTIVKVAITQKDIPTHHKVHILICVNALREINLTGFIPPTRD